MCLETYWKKPKVAKEDIICYKVLSLTKEGLYSPFQDYKYDGELIKADGRIDRRKRYSFKFSLFKRQYYTIHGGMLHCFVSKKLAKTLQLSLITIGSAITYECVIPKGTEYYISTDEEGICAKAIRLIKEI